MTGAGRLPIAVLISGGGTNLQAILDAVAEGRLAAEVTLVVSSNPEAGGLARAQRAGVPTRVIRSKDFPDLASFRRGLLDALQGSGARLVVLAGYMKKLPVDVIRAYDGWMVNIHPALLPKFGGKGFYGRRVHEAVLAAGETESGATVHVVTEEYDAGAVLIQEKVPVRADDTADSLAARVLEVEHRILPAAIQAYAQGRIRREGERFRIEASRSQQNPQETRQ
ncbi:MAG: phosphoribosylglycinamide formyltransferase [Candidatus Eisenbacteria bacterium]|nr:phosphoribosylglycinamide formyltransferase [Candidatus Eisenbacteria bacterium]